MTYIEFFEKDAVENICTCLMRAPDRMILMGNNGNLLKEHAERYRRFLADRGMQVEIIQRIVNKNNLQNIVDQLSKIIETYEDCVFDLTGGEDLYLVAMGIVFERYKHKGIQMHRFNILNGNIIDCDKDGKTIAEDGSVKLSVEENIRIYGGDVAYHHGSENSSVKWDMTDEFKKDIDAIWEICRQDAKLWNAQIEIFAVAEKIRDKSNASLTTTASIPRIAETLERSGKKYFADHRILNGLKNAGLITSFESSDETFSIAYKNEQIKTCLTKAGQVLEMKMYKAALEASEKDGTLTYNDVMTGVYIDWDDIHGERVGHDTKNEIDVMMMHGLVPVFVSCKNGNVGIDELYKLDTVANRFGGKYAKKILIATALGDSGSSEYLRQRASDMGIRLVEDVQEMDNCELNRIVRSFWSN